MSSDLSFTMLFSSITISTVWCEPHTTLRVWITMLADCDRRGYVYGSIPGLANLARVTVEECEQAIRTFLAPDPYSRTPDNEGRRIEEAEGGWRLLNYDLYRGRKDERAVRDAKRDHMRRVRGEALENSTGGKNDSTGGNENPKWNECGDIAEGRGQKQSKTKSKGAPPVVLPDWLPGDAWDDWHAYRNARKGWTTKARELSLRRLTALHAEGHDPRGVIEQSIERGWTGLFPVKEDSRGTSHAGTGTRSTVERVRANAEAGERADRDGR